MELPELPGARVSVEGDAARVKPAGTVTVSDTVVVLTMLPEVPVTVIGYVPALTEEPTVIDMVELPDPVIEVGLKLTVTPVGRPVAVRSITELNPPVTELEMVDEPVLP